MILVLKRPLIRLALTGVVVFAAACSGGGEKLAEYEGGAVLRSDLRLLMRLYHGQQAERNASTEEQDRLVREYALQRIAAAAARKAGLEQDAEYKQSAQFLDDRARLLAANLRLGAEFPDRDLKFYEMQFLFLANPPGATEGARSAEGRELLAELEKLEGREQEIEDLIGRRTEHQRYRYNGGYLDPHCVSCQPDLLDFFTSPLKEAEEKKFILVERPEGVVLIRKFKEYEVNPDGVQRRYEAFYERSFAVARRLTGALSEAEKQNPQVQQLLQQLIMPEAQRKELAKMQAERISNQEGRNPLNGRLIELRDALKVKLEPAGTPQQSAGYDALPAEAALFRIGESAYTKKQLEERLQAAAPLTAEQKLQVLQNLILPIEMLARAEEFKGIEESAEFQFAREYYDSAALGQIYMRQQAKPAAVGEQQILDWYNLRRLQNYAGRSLGEVRGEIRAQLEMGEQQRVSQEVQQRLAEQAKLVVHRERLKANSL